MQQHSPPHCNLTNWLPRCERTTELLACRLLYPAQPGKLPLTTPRRCSWTATTAPLYAGSLYSPPGKHLTTTASDHAPPCLKHARSPAAAAVSTFHALASAIVSLPTSETQAEVAAPIAMVALPWLLGLQQALHLACLHHPATYWQP
eukprot:1142459-Pelagomonas_calceolata.AAC.8